MDRPATRVRGPDARKWGMSEAVVVGSGPNGLAAALTLVEAGLSVRVLEARSTPGGGTRSSELTLPGLIHDECSGFHPMGVASPFFQGQNLEPYGLRWRWPEIELAHPLDGGRAALLWRDVDRTADGLGPDGDAWRRPFGRLSRHFDAVFAEVAQPVLHLPRHPVTFARFGLHALLPATVFARRFRGAEARALFGGVAAHAFSRLDTPLSSSVGLVLGAAGHAYGWPVAEGGSGAIADAMVAKLRDLGAKVETDVEVTDHRQLDDPDVVLFDTTPAAAARILGDRLPRRVQRAYRRFRHGPAAYKIDLALEGPIPWTNPDVGRAGTVHLGGTFEEIARAEASVVAGRLPADPFILLGQQYVADPSRSVGDLHPVYLYGHVPAGYRGDATDVLLAQVERFAPGFRARIRHTTVTGPADLERTNQNYVGGDIAGGASTMLQLVGRPRLALDPYATTVPGAFLCSASTPPGAGVHGMSGANAARRALRHLAR